MHYYIEYGGGLGDVLHQMYQNFSYNVLDHLGRFDTAEISLITHNPHVVELFKWHPNAGKITVTDYGYWSPAQDAEKRKQHNLPPHGANGQLPVFPGPIKFYPDPEEQHLVDMLKGRRGYFVMSAAAGLQERSIPDEIIDKILFYFSGCGMPMVAIGRNYERHGRKEREFGPMSELFIFNMIDRLSVPGTAAIVQNSLGVICCHSSMSILSWQEQKPTLLLYPQSVKEKHINNRDQWVFGIDYPTTVHAEFSEFTTEYLLKFSDIMRNAM